MNNFFPLISHLSLIRIRWHSMQFDRPRRRLTMRIVMPERQHTESDFITCAFIFSLDFFAKKRLNDPSAPGYDPSTKPFLSRPKIPPREFNEQPLAIFAEVFAFLRSITAHEKCKFAASRAKLPVAVLICMRPRT
jgi:hypothetical protein